MPSLTWTNKSKLDNPFWKTRNVLWSISGLTLASTIIGVTASIFLRNNAHWAKSFKVHPGTRDIVRFAIKNEGSLNIGFSLLFLTSVISGAYGLAAHQYAILYN